MTLAARHDQGMTPAREDGKPAPVLRLDGFGVGHLRRVILAEIDLVMPSDGVLVLMGPCGTGKSTLLRALCGALASNPSFRTWGEAEYLGQPLGSGDRWPVLVGQSARALMSSVFENLVCNLPERQHRTHAQQRAIVGRFLEERALDALLPRLDDPVETLSPGMQRLVAILRAIVADPELLCLDEPTAGLDDAEADSMIALLHRESTRRGLIISTHHQGHARLLAGRLVLMAGGRIQESAATSVFFATPRTEAGREFVRGGTCRLPSPDAEPEEIDDDVPPPPPLPHVAKVAMSDFRGPRGFRWLMPGRLAGTPRPGVVGDIDHDLAALRSLGIRHLINLTGHPIETLRLAKFGIEGHSFPVADMQPPSTSQAIGIFESIDRFMTANEPVAVHCHAGLGRTGTVMAMYLVWCGADASIALEAVRGIEAGWVQSTHQIHAIENFPVRRPQER